MKNIILVIIYAFYVHNRSRVNDKGITSRFFAAESLRMYNESTLSIGHN